MVDKIKPKVIDRVDFENIYCIHPNKSRLELQSNSGINGLVTFGKVIQTGCNNQGQICDVLEQRGRRGQHMKSTESYRV